MRGSCSSSGTPRCTAKLAAADAATHAALAHLALVARLDAAPVRGRAGRPGSATARRTRPSRSASQERSDANRQRGCRLRCCAQRPRRDPRALDAPPLPRTSRARRSGAPTRSPSPSAPRADPAACAARGRPAAGTRRRSPAPSSGSGIRQFSPSTQKSRLPCASVQTTAQPVAIASSGGSAKPSCVEVWTNTVASLKQLVDLLVAGRRPRSACPLRSASSGSIPNRHSSGRGSGSAAPCRRS